MPHAKSNQRANPWDASRFWEKYCMPSEPDIVDLENVRSRELDEIVKRRREANIASEKDDQGHPKSPGGDLVGLALSGGGVRSASFNLGLLQSLYRNGILRHVDYMSTVSGGGYVGSSLSSLALHPDTEFDWKRDDAEDDDADVNESPEHAGRRFTLAPREDGRQPPRVLELIHGGEYLRRPLIFLNRYLVGVLLTNVVALSFVFALTALVAMLFRYLDHTWMINWLFALGFQGDISRAFFPTVLFFSLWLVMWAISYWRKGSRAEGRVARWFMTLTIMSFLLGGAALLGTGDVSLTHLRDNYGIEPPSELVDLGGELKTYFVIALAIALIPYLRIKELIRSGTRPRTAVEGWIFAVASRALLYGLPLLIFGWLARENISLFNENRHEHRYGVKFNTQYDFVPLEFRDWSGTWQEIELQATKLSGTSAGGRLEVSQRMWNPVAPYELTNGANVRGVDETVADQKQGVDVGQGDQLDAYHDQIVQTRKLVMRMSAFDRDTSMIQRWQMYLGYLVTGHPNGVTEQFDRRQQYLDLRWKICRRLTNTILVDSQFYREFATAKQDLAVIQAGDLKQQEDNLREINSLVVSAEHLEKQISDLGQNGPEFLTWLKDREALIAKLDDNARKGISEGNLGLQKELRQLMGREQYVLLENELKAVNWQLLRAYWGEQLAPKSTVYAMVCLAADQETRWMWFLWAFGLFALSACVVNMNATSLHGFYRNMLARMWITECPGIGRRIPLARLETVARGAPYHLICATVHMLGRRRRTDQSTTDTFIFSQAYCGSSRTGYVPTDGYMFGSFDLANAMALSGAAVSPTQVHNPLLAVLLMLSNSRLGQWLPNPGHRVLSLAWLDRIVSLLPPVPLRLMVGTMQKAENRNYCFVSDGGHHENLGLESLLLRRCRLIIAADVSGDPCYEFRDFVHLLRRMRFEYGIRIVGLDGLDSGVPLETLVPHRLRDADDRSEKQPTIDATLDNNLAESHYLVARILYPDDGPSDAPREGYLVYIKPNFTGDEAIDLARYPLEAPAFPHDPTTDQFYAPQKFESYRQLGFHIGETVCREQFSQYQSHDEFAPTMRQWSPVEPGSQRNERPTAEPLCKIRLDAVDRKNQHQPQRIPK
jgi:hypothetical protein